MVLQAYIDGSGSSQDPALVLAGYIAPVEKWAAFAAEWHRILNMPLPIKYFKMNEANTLRGQFNGFSESRRDERVRLFYEAIENNVTACVWCVVPFADFNRARTVFPVRVRLQPYHVAFMSINGLLTENRHKLGLDDKIDFIFDEEVIHKTALLSSWDWVIEHLSEDQRARVGKTPIFRDDEDVLPLQAADLAAWWLRRWWEENTIGRAAPTPPWAEKREIPSLGKKIDETTLREIFQAAVANVRPPSNESLV